MARMLGKMGSIRSCWGCCLGRRGQRSREGQAFRRALPGIQAEAGSEWLAAILGSLFDPSDCQHGCNGDCVTSGSDRCNFTCH